MAYQANKEYDKAIENFKRYLLEVPEERTYIVVANIYIGSFKDNKKAKEIQGYKRKFKNLPTLEHVYREDVSITLEFVICGWAVNDAKNDLSIDEFIELCKEVVEYHENK